MRIKVILPVPVQAGGGGPVADLIAARRRAAAPTTTLEFVAPRNGLARLSSLADRFISAQTLWPAAAIAGVQGFDAVVVDCTCDQLSDMSGRPAVPLISALQSALHAAALVADRLAIVTPNPGQAAIYHWLTRRYGFERTVVAVREACVDPGCSQEEQFAALKEASERVIKEDGAESIILGCTAFTEDGRLSEALGAHVVAPGSVAVKTAEMLVELGYRAPTGSDHLHETRPWAYGAQEFDRVEMSRDGRVLVTLEDEI